MPPSWKSLLGAPLLGWGGGSWSGSFPFLRVRGSLVQLQVDIYLPLGNSGKFRSQLIRPRLVDVSWCCLCLCRVALLVLGNWPPFLVCIWLPLTESQPNCHKQFGIIQSEWMQWLRGTSCQICVSNARNQAQQVFGGVLEWCFSILRMYNVDWLSKRDVILVAAGLELFPCILVGTVKELHRILDDWMVDIIISYIKCWRSWAQFRRYKRWRS